MTSVSPIHKKRSTRMSFASRQSLANLMGRRSFAPKSSSGSSKNIGVFTDSRCYKHSPRVGQHHTYVGEELARFEATQWRAAFSAMGGLRQRGVKAPKPFTVLNKAPYHCSSMGRTFEVRYGELIKLQPPVFRKTKKADRPQICNCITKEVLPIFQEKRVTGPFDLSSSVSDTRPLPKTRYYLPKSCVIVRWDPLVHSSVDKICEWLITTFGPFLFTTRSASNSMLVAFETMEQAHRAVTFQLKASAKITIKWHDSAMYNFGHFTKYSDYTVGTDPIWRKGMEEKAKPRPTRSTQNEINMKPKRLKITGI
ncbi:hypothetical protein ElyMa_003278100 [Elysia marginata]|uniref:RRM domain-containing protein n=1 Tax=Elysia marginata TaxID=1093978 RepID=A0AAV4J8M0_9GAST|nr:hypothetical protein ElyMa_003278100 [Elysia marginata]